MLYSLDTKISDLPLSIRALFLLKELNISTLRQLSQMNKVELLRKSRRMIEQIKKSNPLKVKRFPTLKVLGELDDFFAENNIKWGNLVSESTNLSIDSFEKMETHKKSRQRIVNACKKK